MKKKARSTKSTKVSINKTVIGIGILLILIFVATSIFFFCKYRNTLNNLNIAQEKIDELTSVNPKDKLTNEEIEEYRKNNEELSKKLVSKNMSHTSLYSKLLEIINNYYIEMLANMGENKNEIIKFENGKIQYKKEVGYFVVDTFNVNLPTINDRVFLDEEDDLLKVRLRMPNYNSWSEEVFVLW